MINELSMRPKAKNNNAKIAFMLTLLVAIVAFCFYFALDKYKGLIGLFGIGALTTAILFYTKYISVEFCYDITFDIEETPIFVVRQITGKRVSTLCRVNLHDIISVSYETKKETSEHKREMGVRLYKYTPTLMPSEVYRIFSSGRYEKAEILIECTKEFADTLLEYAKEAREAYLASEAME